jgi:uncharacterized protein
MCLPLSVQAASFDCTKASHPLEKLICANASLSKLDEDLAKTYREKLEILFDKRALKGQQMDWQQILRTRCETECLLQNVEPEYQAQIEFLENIQTESYSANYKTADISILTITHLDDPKQFDFMITRTFVDESAGNPLCALPENGSEPGAIAIMDGPDHASWKSGECEIDFSFERDEKGNVGQITLESSAACKKSYCSDKRYGLDDNYMPDNTWVAGTQ